MRKTNFAIDCFEDEIFEGYTDGRLWNGWACPWFSKEVADKIMRINNAYYDDGVTYQMRYDADRDAYILADFYDEPEIFEGHNVEGVQLYPIGNASWIWEEVEDEKGSGGLWDKAGEIATQIGLAYKIAHPDKFKRFEPIYAEDFGQEIIYNLLKGEIL